MVLQEINRQVLDANIKVQFEAQTPCGIFLSGGVDSLALLHWISLEAPQLIPNLTAFTIRKESPKYAAAIVEKYQLPRHILVDRGDNKVAATKVLNDYTDIKYFFAGVTSLPPVNLNFEGPVAIRKDRPSLRMQLPFFKLDKRYTTKLALDLNAPIDMTHTCTKFEEKNCGNCFMCAERLWAFEQLNTKDVLHYENY